MGLLPLNAERTVTPDTTSTKIFFSVDKFVKLLFEAMKASYDEKHFFSFENVNQKKV